MKNLAVLALSICLIILSCKKNDTPPISTTKPTCTDGIKNGDETDIDCGGSCTPCQQIDIPALNAKVEAFLTKYNITGASLAVTKNEKLVYAKGFGFADKENNEKVTPESLFRLASVSKTYTSVAIMRLVQDGKLKIDDKVFGEGAILGKMYGKNAYSENLTKITVRHLLQNVSGAWGVNSGGDVIDQNPTMTNSEFLSWVLDTRPTPNVPNTVYDYSNVNFFIAGRIIEKLTGKTYQNYIREDILSKLGITTTEIAGSTLAERKKNEVKYYGQDTDANYTYNILFKRRDADGGWITSAKELLKFVAAFDGFPNRPDILNADNVKVLTTPSPVFENYCLGIGKYQNWWYNYGSLPGTRTGFIRMDNGMSVALLLNSRISDPQNTAFIYDKQDLMLDVCQNSAYKWQSIDQF